jgi:hypothetical protein
MHRIYPALSAEQQAELIELSKEMKWIEAYSFRRRMGVNGADALSIYKNTRWFTWTAKQRNKYKALLPEHMVNQAVVGWYLDLPAGDGFLDRMTVWVDKPNSGTAIAYALRGDQTILINDKPVLVKQGQGIGFSLREIHEIKPSEEGQLWACVMVRGQPVEFG